VAIIENPVRPVDDAMLSMATRTKEHSLSTVDVETRFQLRRRIADA
jgi:hypothetical protein